MEIYNLVIQTGIYPHAMKLPQVIALYKKGCKVWSQHVSPN